MKNKSTIKELKYLKDNFDLKFNNFTDILKKYDQTPDYLQVIHQEFDKIMLNISNSDHLKSYNAAKFLDLLAKKNSVFIPVGDFYHQLRLQSNSSETFKSMLETFENFIITKQIVNVIDLILTYKPLDNPMQSHSFLKLIKPFCYTEDKNLSFCDTQKHYKTDINNDFLFKVTNALGVEQCGQLNKILINSSKSINISNSLFAKILGTIDEYSNAMRTNYDKDGFFPKSKAQILIDDQNDKKVKISDNKLDIENDACAKVEVSISKYTKVYDKLSQDQPKAQSYNAPLKDPKSNNSNIKSSKSLVTKNKVIEKSQNFEDIISDNNHLEISFSHEQRNQSNYIPRLGEGNDYADY